MKKPPSPPASDLQAIQIIRTETVLSKLPVHNLSKTGDFEITILQRKPSGEVELQWVVSYSARYGPPRQLAYKLDTIVINRTLDQLGRPLPRIIRLGSLREIARELNLGGDTNQIRKALRQNAFTGITARLTYRTATGEERRIEADFTRYSVIFAGEQLPDGGTADAVYVILNQPYLEVLNQAPVRPLNYEYLKELPPAAQRFYEILSYRVYAAIKHGHTQARLSYADFCTYSALQRYTDYDHFKKQMYKIHKPHLDSGYIAKVVYQDTLADDNRPDWLMLYTPGPKARQDYDAFHRRRGTTPTATVPDPPQPNAQPDDRVVSALCARGVIEQQARRVAAQLQDGQPVEAQLSWADAIVRRAGGSITNPAGFYVYFLRQNMPPPHEYVVPVGSESDSATVALSATVAAYEEYRAKKIDDAVHQLSSETWETRVADKGRELRRQHPAARFWPPADLRQVAEAQARLDLATQLALPTYAEFLQQWGDK